MNVTVWERVQKLQDLIEKRHVTWFMGAAFLVALMSLWDL